MDSAVRLFQFWIRYLQIVSLFFAGLGILWPLIGSFDPFGIYDRWMAQTFFQTDSLTAETQRVYRFILGPFGLTNTGYFILQLYLVTYALQKKEPWAYQAISTAFLVWFCCDSLLSVYHGAWFNIWLANLPALGLMLPPLIAMPKYLKN